MAARLLARASAACLLVNEDSSQQPPTLPDRPWLKKPRSILPLAARIGESLCWKGAALYPAAAPDSAGRHFAARSRPA